jgi:predicted dithiol-disulfide oxidoreductase (DUF899 family)
MRQLVVSRDEWTNARVALLTQEKELTRLRDAISRQRRELPWVRVDKDYRFESSRGTQTLSDLFEGRSQLLVYHFMFDPGWTDGCKSCSFWADNYDGIDVHLAQRDVTMGTISRAPFPAVDERRMGWTFTWVSSFGSDFNHDFHVPFTEDERKGDVDYNFERSRFGAPEAPGPSVFYRDEDGAVYHTYSCYARGLDAMNGVFQWLDLTPKGRDEDGLSVRRWSGCVITTTMSPDWQGTTHLDRRSVRYLFEGLLFLKLFIPKIVPEIVTASARNLPEDDGDGGRRWVQMTCINSGSRSSHSSRRTRRRPRAL